MHLIARVPASGQGDARGLAPYSGGELSSLREGDTVWLVTRLPDERGTPALCGRIIIAPQRASPSGELDDATHNPYESERCEPFPCDTVRSWHVWRAPFEGLAPLTDMQAECLETFWAGSEGRRMTHREGPPAA